MNPIAAAAASGMRARLDSLDMLANNLSNASTNGFKLDREFYATHSPEDGDGSTALPYVSRPWVDFSQGVLTPTGNPMDFAISGSGFFAVKSPSGVLYTRNGAFRLSSDGKLSTSDGMLVLGRGGSTIQLDPGKPIELDKDGTIRQDGVAAGQVEITEFKTTDNLYKHGGNYFTYRGEATGKSASTAPDVHQGRLEGSNVSAADISVRIVGVMRQFEMLHKAMNLAGEMDKRSIEEIAKVTP